MDVSPEHLSPQAIRILAQVIGGLTNDQIVLIVVIVAISGLLLITTRRRVRQAQNSPQAYTREQRSRIKDEQSLVANIEELMAELENVSRQMQARLDTKFAKFESAIRDADERADRLERLVRRADGGPTLDVTVDDNVREDERPAAADDSRHEAVFRMADAGLTAQQIAADTGQTVGEIELILALRKAAGAVQS